VYLPPLVFPNRVNKIFKYIHILSVCEAWDTLHNFVSSGGYNNFLKEVYGINVLFASLRILRSLFVVDLKSNQSKGVESYVR
jgi:hypothetical protein